MRRDSRTVLTAWARPPDFTVRYGDAAEHIADVRLPTTIDTARSAPLLLFLHGGFWRESFDRTHTGPLAASLADGGFVVATPEYRRIGAGPGAIGWPRTFDDVRAAAHAVPRLVADRAAPVEVDLDRVLLAGHSAGGHLALWAAGDLTRDGQAVRAVVALAAVADLRAAYDLDLDGGAVAGLLGGGPDEVPERFAAADPMALLPVGTPTVLVHGGRDRQVPVEFSRRYARAARAAGDEVTLIHLPEADHFQLIDPESEAWSDVADAFGAVGRP